MWFQVELPRPETITEIQFDSGPPGGRGARGGGGGRGPAQGRGGQRGGQTPAAPVAGRGAAPVFGSFPLGYRVQVSLDGKTWSGPVAEGKGSTATTIATFRPVQAKFVRVMQTDKADGAPPWSVLNFRVYTSGARANDDARRR